MSRYKETGIGVSDTEVARIYTYWEDYAGTCINIDIEPETTTIYLTKDELKAMIAAIDAREAAEKIEELPRD